MRRPGYLGDYDGIHPRNLGIVPPPTPSPIPSPMPSPTPPGPIPPPMPGPPMPGPIPPPMPHGGGGGHHRRHRHHDDSGSGGGWGPYPPYPYPIYDYGYPLTPIEIVPEYPVIRKSKISDEDIIKLMALIQATSNPQQKRSLLATLREWWSRR